MHPSGGRPGYRSPRLLPPIPNGEAPQTSGEFSGGSHSLKPRSGEQRMWSRYHSGCVDRSPSRVDAATRGQKKKSSAFFPNERTRARFGLFRDGDGVEVMNYLDRNRDLLEAYVVESVPIEELERWFFRKIKHNFIDDNTQTYTNRSKVKQAEVSPTKPTFVSLVKNLQGELSEHAVLLELAKTITSAVGVDAYRIYKMYPDHPTFVQCFVLDTKQNTEAKPSLTLDRAAPEQVVLVLEVAKKMTSLRISRHEDPIRFPDTPQALFKAFKIKDGERDANHILYQPILTSSGKTGYVIEMWRVQDRFREIDEQVSANFMVWGSLALHYCNMYLDKKRERNMSDFLLDVVKEVDEATGYKTISILCMPVKVEGKVIGVVQMVNKRNDDNFDREDEVSFEIFSTFFGLALHHARLYDRIMRKEQKYRVALEVLSYHNTCREFEVQAMLSDKENVAANLNDFALDPYKFSEFQKCKCVISMFDDLFDLSKFDLLTLTRFVLTVKKNYRAVPYHNFDHGWSVAHAMYVILKNDANERFDYIRRLALFVSSLCHDLDHRGYTNKYMSETASPLAAMYTTSTLEHHHFNITVTILQQDGHNIFSHISSEEYKEILGYIRQAILATDLAAFFPNLAKMKDLHSECSAQTFNWSIPTHKDLAMAISMTAADLSASAKPWGVQIKTVKVIFKEFYDQGDKERAIGKTPIPMMDRNKPHEQPSSQVGFLSQICVPCYAMLYKILPHTEPMYEMAMKNLERWKFRAERVVSTGRFESIESFGEDEVAEFDLKEEEHSSFTADVNEDIPGDDVERENNIIEPAEGTSQDKEQDDNPISWEEESITDALAESVERLSGGFWKDDDGTEWIDEEGVVVKSNALKGVIKNVGKPSTEFSDKP